MDVRFNPYRVRRLGLSSTQEAKILLYLENQSQVSRKALGRLFDLRLVERLIALGLVAQDNGGYCLTENGRKVLEECIGGDA